MNGVTPVDRFQRFWQAPTMEADTLVATLRDLEAEGSSDVLLFQALSRRFRAHAEEFFPPQVDAIVASFAGLRFADEALLEGFAGRLGDLASDASPRRVVRLLRNGAALQLAPEAWMPALLPQIHRHLPNFREGLPTGLAALHAMRWRDEQLVELLLTQGLLVTDELGDGFFTRLFERWTRFGFRHSEAEGIAVDLATKGAAVHMDFDLKDSLNLLAGLYRCGGSAAGDARQRLEERLEARLRRNVLDAEGDALATSPGPAATPAEEAATALAWMSRLALRSPRLWRACADSVEVALKDPAFAIRQLPDALHALAVLLGGRGPEDAQEGALVAAFLNTAELRQALPKYTASQALHILLAACMVRLCAPGAAKARGEVPTDLFLKQATRLAHQLTLPERRALREAAESLKDLPETSAAVEALKALPLVALPPVGTAEEADWNVADVGAESLLVRPGTGRKTGMRFLGFKDTFAAAPGGDSPVREVTSTTPSCRLSVRAMELQGWRVELRA